MDILVFGATGYTGRKIVAELALHKLNFGIAGRSLSRLTALKQELGLPTDLPTLVADPTDSDSLAALFQPSLKVLINCVGPFTRYGEPVVRAAVEAGVHYLDITGEQQYIARIIDKYDVLAKQRGCAIIPACGVEYALTNWLAALVAHNREPLDEIWTGTAIRQVKVSRGTLLSLFAILGEPGFGWQAGRRVSRRAASVTRKIDFPAPFGTLEALWAPFGEMLTIPRHIQVRNMQSFFSVGNSTVKTLAAFAPFLPLISKIMRAVLQPFAKSPDIAKPEESVFALVAEGVNAQGKRRAQLVGKNVYELTGTLVVWCAEQLCSPTFAQTGVLGPAQAFDPQTALDYLTDKTELRYELT